MDKTCQVVCAKKSNTTK